MKFDTILSPLEMLPETDSITLEDSQDPMRLTPLPVERVTKKTLILLMAEILHQLRLVVFPIIYRVSYIPGGAGFQPSTVLTWPGPIFSRDLEKTVGRIRLRFKGWSSFTECPVGFWIFREAYHKGVPWLGVAGITLEMFVNFWFKDWNSRLNMTPPPPPRAVSI